MLDDANKSRGFTTNITSSDKFNKQNPCHMEGQD